MQKVIQARKQRPLYSPDVDISDNQTLNPERWTQNLLLNLFTLPKIFLCFSPDLAIISTSFQLSPPNFFSKSADNN